MDKVIALLEKNNELLTEVRDELVTINRRTEMQLKEQSPLSGQAEELLALVKTFLPGGGHHG